MTLLNKFLDIQLLLNEPVLLIILPFVSVCCVVTVVILSGIENT